MNDNSAGGDLVVQQQAAPSGDCPPDVYEFVAGDDIAHLCLRCALHRANTGTHWIGAIGPLIEDGVCEDCGNE